MKRSPAVAGMFYPKNPQELKDMIHQFVNRPDKVSLPGLKAIIVPHAGYIYSGPIAGSAYAQIAKNVPEAHRKTIILIGPAHFGFTVASVGDYNCLITPLGDLKVNSKIVGELESKGLGFDEEVHRPEHSLEVQLPFIQAVSPGSDIVPILCGSVTPDALAEVLGPYFVRSDCFFIISSDLSHYSPYAEAVETDKRSLLAIKNLDFQGEGAVDACGKVGILTLMRLAKKGGYKMKVLDYRNSGDTAGDKSAVVGYATVACYQKS
jgi:MEMO1 family protein